MFKWDDIDLRKSWKQQKFKDSSYLHQDVAAQYSQVDKKPIE